MKLSIRAAPVPADLYRGRECSSMAASHHRSADQSTRIPAVRHKLRDATSPGLGYHRGSLDQGHPATPELPHGRDRGTKRELVFFERYRQNTTDLFERLRPPVLKEVEKNDFIAASLTLRAPWRVPACASSSRCSRNTALTRSGIQLLQREPKTVSSEVWWPRTRTEVLEAVSIGIACVLASALSVTREIITQEGFDMGGDRRHGCASPDMKRCFRRQLDLA